MAVRFLDKYAKGFYSDEEYSHVKELLIAADAKLRAESDVNEYKGWYELPFDYDKEELEEIKRVAAKIQKDSDILLVIGIGGSYLGARAAIEFLKSQHYNAMKKDTPEIYFVGNSFSPDDFSDIVSLCEGKDVSVNVISKSGSTTESAIAFRFVRHLMLQKYTDAEIKERIFVTTDCKKGALKNFADRERLKTFVIPDDVGGRFSVLTAVGLLPIAVCGADIDEILAGAADMKRRMDAQGMDNEAYKYAVLRNIFYSQEKFIEILVSYEPSFRSMAEWWKQLFGESEGKGGKGIFPAAVTFSTDLHSLGQYIQDGKRCLFETVVKQTEVKNELYVPANAVDIDGLGFLAGKKLSSVNSKALMGTLLAHTDGGVPNLVIEYDKRDERNLGELIYFFFLAVSVSGYMLGVNPFDQPGVEAYKRNMFALLGKDGYSELREELDKKLSELGH